MLAGPYGSSGKCSKAPTQFASREGLLHPWCLLALAILCSFALLAPSRAHGGAPPEVLAGAILFGTVFESLADPDALARRDVPDEVRPRIEAFAARAEAFRSRLPEVERPRGPEVWAVEKRRHMERDMVALIDTPGIEKAACDYAAAAVLAYEWEGFSEVPLKEAACAADFLASHPTTPLRPYLNLFLAHRYRCATEILRGERGARDATTRAAANYKACLEVALKDPDPLVRFVAADMEKRPHLYLEETEARLQRGPVGGAPCPDAALPGAIQDPRAWALACFVISAGPEAASPGTLSEFQADLYGEGQPALFIGSTVDRGNAGGMHYVFKQEGSAYRYLGSLFLHPKAFETLGPGADGNPRMIRYHRLGADEGLLQSVVYDGKSFVVTRSEKVFAQGRDRARFCELFELMCREDPEPGPLTAREPPLPLRRALDLAEGNVEDKRIDLTGQYLHSIGLRYDENARTSYWHVQWMWSQPRIGGEFGLRVYMNGQVVPAPLGP
ncbi:MAG: hypothetical protein AB1640_06705 [bacterium]